VRRRHPGHAGNRAFAEDGWDAAEVLEHQEGAAVQRRGERDFQIDRGRFDDSAAVFIRDFAKLA
jgi:hypothetical protein